MPRLNEFGRALIMWTSALYFILSLLAGMACFAPSAGAVDSDEPSPAVGAPDLASVRAKVKATDFRGAIAELTPILRAKPNADVHNLMGFSLRKTGDFTQALTHYQKALELDPKHKGALEYLGELYVEINQTDKAREIATRLKKLCPKGCEELTDLEQALARAARPK